MVSKCRFSFIRMLGGALLVLGTIVMRDLYLYIRGSLLDIEYAPVEIAVFGAAIVICALLGGYLVVFYEEEKKEGGE